MQIQKRYVASGYRFGIAIFATIGFCTELSILGRNGWRTFGVWVMGFTLAYFLLLAAVTVLTRKRPADKALCPMLYGLVLANNLYLMLFWTLAHLCRLGWPGVSGISGFIINFLVPILTLFDWIIFVQKGIWRAIEPFYWLVPSIVFLCGILLTADFLPAQSSWQYPYIFLDFNHIGIDKMLWYGALIVTLELIAGYSLMLIDFAVSGRLSQHVVMPKIKTIVIEEEIPDDEEEVVSDSVKASTQPSQKNAKPVDGVTARPKPNSAKSKAKNSQPKPKAPTGKTDTAKTVPKKSNPGKTKS